MRYPVGGAKRKCVPTADDETAAPSNSESDEELEDGADELENVGADDSVEKSDRKHQLDLEDIFLGSLSINVRDCAQAEVQEEQKKGRKEQTGNELQSNRVGTVEESED